VSDQPKSAGRFGNRAKPEKYRPMVSYTIRLPPQLLTRLTELNQSRWPLIKDWRARWHRTMPMVHADAMRCGGSSPGGWTSPKGESNAKRRDRRSGGGVVFFRIGGDTNGARRGEVTAAQREQERQ
jgi:hypothetical protein